MNRKRTLIAVGLITIVLSIMLFQISSGLATVVYFSDFNNRIAELQSTYRDGEYWNHYNSSDYSRSGTVMCPTQACRDRGYCAPDCPCECGQFYCDNSWQGGQCHGFAMKMAYLAIGSNPQTSDEWVVSDSITILRYGDVVRYNVNGIQHTIFITSVSGENVTFADCNFTGPCRIRWNGTTTVETLKNNLVSIWSHP
jgi:hypothetical protein